MQQSYPMEIIFKSPTHPEGRPLHDALAENCLEALSTLSSAICDTMFTMNLFSSESFLSSLQSIQFLVSRFRLELENINPGFTFTLKELYIIQDASLSLYGEADIEGAFYKYGGYDGIIALILYFRNSENVSKAWNTIIEGHRRWFVKYIARMLSRQKVELVSQYHNIKRSLNPHTLLFYLGNHAGRKRKRRTLETKGSPTATQSPLKSALAIVPQSPQSQSIYQIGQQVAGLPRRAGNTHQRVQPSSQSHQHTLAPIIISSPSVLALPLLIHSLGCPQIHSEILFRGLLPQKRWDQDGNVCEVLPRDAGFNEQITHLFSSRDQLEQTIKSCLQLEFVVQDLVPGGETLYSIGDQSRHQIIQFCTNEEELRLIGLVFITHIYPRDPILEPSFQAIEKLLLPYLKRMWQLFLREPPFKLPAHIRDSMVEASLATYKLFSKDVLTKFHDPDLPNYLRMAIVTRESISIRLKGDHIRSDIVIQDILKSLAIDSKDIRLHCAYGRLLLSRTENAILRKEFDRAESYLASWDVKSLQGPSGLELQMVRLKNTVYGRVSRYKGNFEHARHCLEACLETFPVDGSRYHILYHLGDVYCELGIPNETEKLVLEEINQLAACGKQHSKSFRRLALPLVEAYIQQGKLEVGRTLLGELLITFQGIVNHDVPDQLGHVRLMIGLARVYWSQKRWSEAHQTLEQALVLTENYRTFSRGNFYVGVIYLFLSLTNFELRKYRETRLSLASADEILCKETPRHFIPGMGSYFLWELLRNAESLPWPSTLIHRRSSNDVEAGHWAQSCLKRLERRTPQCLGCEIS